ncbi:hypothetical protein GCM10029992_37850 [Glycomyces albus]
MIGVPDDSSLEAEKSLVVTVAGEPAPPLGWFGTSSRGCGFVAELGRLRCAAAAVRPRMSRSRSRIGAGLVEVPESRSIKTMAVAANLGGLAFPKARLALRVHRRRKESGKAETRETVVR